MSPYRHFFLSFCLVLNGQSHWLLTGIIKAVSYPTRAPQVVRGLSSGARVFEYMTLEPSIQVLGGGRIPSTSLTGRIDFMDISFTWEGPVLQCSLQILRKLQSHACDKVNKFLSVCSYPTRPGHQILKGFNLTLPPAKTVAIVGESGGGKNLKPARAVITVQLGLLKSRNHLPDPALFIPFINTFPHWCNVHRKVHCGSSAGAILRPR